MIVGQIPTRQAPSVPSSLPSVSDVLSSRRFSALSNVIVFTPYAIYLARGKRPPPWLIVASLAFLAVSFFEDMRILAAPDASTSLAAYAKGPLTNGCACPPASPRPAHPPLTAQDAWRYRVNR